MLEHRVIKPFDFESLGEEFGSSPYARKKEELPPEPPPPPTFTEEELQQKVQEGYNNGMADGLAKGRAEAEDKNRVANEQLSKTLDKAIAVIQTMDAKYQIDIDRIHSTLPKLVIAIAKKVAGRALKEDPMAQIEEVINKSMTVLAQKPEISVFIHPTLADVLKEKLGALCTEKNITTKFTVLPEETLSPADIRLEWKDGGVTTNTEQMWVSIEKMLEETI